MAILGLQDTQDQASNIFGAWRRAILYGFPSGSAPLTALLSLTQPQELPAPEYNWYEKNLPTQAAALTASFTSGATLLLVSAAVFRPGHIIKDVNTDEVMKVVDIDPTGLQLTVYRGQWGSAAASSGSTDDIVVIGNANAEGSNSPESLGYDPDLKTNYCQIFKTPFELTGTALQTAVKYDEAGQWPEKMREGLNTHSIELEKAFIEGKKGRYTNTTYNKVERTTGGIISFIPSANVVTNPGGTNTITQALWDSYLEIAFRKCLNKNMEKLVLAGSGFLANLNTIFRGTGRITLVPKEESFGISIYEYVSPHGTVYLKSHPLWTQNSFWRYGALVIDIAALKYCFLRGRDTTRQKNIQENDSDTRKDQFITECGLEVHHGDAHFLIRGANNAG